jgi:hypothetical protein
MLLYQKQSEPGVNCHQLLTSCSSCGTRALHVRMHPPGGVKLKALLYLFLSQELIASVCTLAYCHQGMRL